MKMNIVMRVMIMIITITQFTSQHHAVAKSNQLRRDLRALLPKPTCKVRNMETSLHDEGDDCALEAAVAFMSVSGTTQATRQGRKRLLQNSSLTRWLV